MKGKFGYDCTNCPANMLGECAENDCEIKIIRNDINELQDIAKYFDSCGKKINGDFVRKIASSYEKLNFGG